MRQAIQAVGSTTTGDEVIIEFLDPFACIIAYGNVYDEANQYCAGVNIQFYCSFIV